MLQIIFLTIASVAIFLPLVGFVAQRLLYRGAPFVQVVAYPLVTVLAQGLAYILILLFMISIVKRSPNQNFWEAIRWNWPPIGKNWKQRTGCG